MATPMQSVLKALKDWYEADAVVLLADDLSDQWFDTDVPESATYPYICVEHTDTMRSDTFGDNGIASAVVMTLVGKRRDGQAAFYALIDKLRTLFDRAALTFSGGAYTSYSIIDVVPGTGSGPIEDGELYVFRQPYTIHAQEA